MIPRPEKIDRWKQGILGIGACLLVGLYLSQFLSRSVSVWIAGLIFDKAGTIGCAILLFVGSWGLGRGFCAKMASFQKNLFEELGIGLSLASTLILILGSFGILNKIFYICLLGLTGVAGLYISGAKWNSTKILRPYNTFAVLGIVTLGILTAIVVFGAYLPTLEYDALEYHVGAPAEYLKEGKIFFLENNVYANFPSLTGMLFLYGLITGGEAVPGMIHAFLGLASLAVLYAMAKDVYSRQTGLIAVIMFLAYPGFFLLSSQPYIDFGVLFFGLLAVKTFIGAEKNRFSGHSLALAGFFTGCAFACKYTAVLVIGVPLGLMLIARILGQGYRARDLIRYLIIFGVFMLLGVSPWLIKNVWMTGNPVYPFLYDIFGGKGWSAEQANLFYQSHLPSPWNLKTLAGILKTMWIEDTHMNLIMVVFLPALFWDRTSKATKIFLGLFLLMLFFYIGWTNALWRFFIPGYAIITLLSARGVDLWLKRLSSSAAKLAVLVLLGFGVFYGAYMNLIFLASHDAFGVILGAEDKETYLARTLPPYPALQVINDLNLDRPGDRILFVGEARTFYVRKRILAHTAFNRNLLEEIFKESGGDLTRAYDKLTRCGVAYIFINYAEVDRLNRSYGYMGKFDWMLFDSFQAKYFEPVYKSENGSLVIQKLKCKEEQTTKAKNTRTAGSRS